MIYLQAEQLSKSFGERVLFSDISLSISKGQKVALIARNGEGKTTLLKILAGIEPSDTGSVSFGRDTRMAYLPQEPQLVESKTVLENVFEGDNPMVSAIKDYELALENQSMKDMESASARMDALNAWDYELKVKQILYRLNITKLNQPVNTLSGGQKKRVALAKVLVEEPDLLILDEPTNHLDIAMIEWLEEYLSASNISLLLVTHDRYFLNEVCNEIIEMENNTLFRHRGNFEYFLEKKAEREFNESKSLEKARNLYKRELEWMRKQPKARTTKAKYRVDAFNDVEEKAHSQKNTQDLQLTMKMSRLGSKILECKHLYKKFGEKVILQDFNYIFQQRERVGIAGENGAGKTTFLNILTGKEQPDRGQLDTGETVVFGYFTQEGLKLKEDKRVIEVVTDIADNIPIAKNQTVSASQFLQMFGFDPPRQHTFVSSLSGGEKRRLHLLTVLVKNPNFLILDEPTNDLDLITLATLENFLLDFQGCLIVVSHDRYFMDKLTEHIFVFEGEGKIKDFPGRYTDYRLWKKEQEKEQEKASAPKKEEKPEVQENKPSKKKLSYKEQREYDMLESEISELEQRKAKLEAKLSAGSNDFNDLQTWSTEIENLIRQIDEKTDRWLELDDIS